MFQEGNNFESNFMGKIFSLELWSKRGKYTTIIVKYTF